MSTYDDNVPQATQTIAQTQPIINENFVFIKGAIGQEHNFDDADETNTYHLQASMPNQADPAALPAGTDGIYYVNGGLPKFYNGTVYSLIGNVQTATGVTSIGSGAAGTILAAGDYMGIVSYTMNTVPQKYQVIQFRMKANSLIANNPFASGGTSLGVLQLNGSFDLQILNNDSFSRSFTWQIFYTPAP